MVIYRIEWQLDLFKINWILQFVTALWLINELWINAKALQYYKYPL